MYIRPFASLLLLLIAASPILADDEYSATTSDSPIPEEVSPEIAKTLSADSIKMMKGEKRTACEIWLCKEWEVKEGFEPTPQVLYPFKPGQLIGVLQFKRRSADFRDQTIDSGVYTLRYMQQPVDGNHVGTSPTRDFILLVSAEDDKDPAILNPMELIVGSAEAAESSHPAMLCLQQPVDAEKLPAVRFNEPHEWHILQFSGSAKVGDKASPLQVDLVVVGLAAE